MANKLELTWYGKENNIEVEPRLLLEDKSLSNCTLDKNTENMLIHGDNLLALKALEKAGYTGKIKCIYIDPPYNTGAAFEHYDDNFEHSIWLGLMQERLVLLAKLLSSDGSIWISIDDEESHYLKVLCDEIFRRSNFVCDITYEKSNVSGLGQGGAIVKTGEKILVYKRENTVFNTVYSSEVLSLKTMKRYKNILVDVGEKELVNEFPAASNGKPVKVFKHKNYQIDKISLRNYEGRKAEINRSYLENFNKIYRTYVIQQENEFQNALMKNMEKGTLYSVEYIPNRGKHKDELTTLYYVDGELCAWLSDTAYIDGNEIKKTTRLSNVWKNDDIPKSDLGNEGGVRFQRSKKPEKLIERILRMSTNEGDLVLDSFLGSGTTASVAHKMGRKWIGVEMGNHAYTHCKKRLDNVVNGQDKTGVTKNCRWQGGGGYRFYELAPSLILEDDFGEMVINKEYNADMLAAAVALHEGFTYAPDKEKFWKQAKANESSYLFTTTRCITQQFLESIHSTMDEGEFLIIACKSFMSGADKLYSNISVKKIPQMLLENCEFGKDDYALNIVHPPVYEDDEEEVEEDE